MLRGGRHPQHGTAVQGALDDNGQQPEQHWRPGWGLQTAAVNSIARHAPAAHLAGHHLARSLQDWVGYCGPRATPAAGHESSAAGALRGSVQATACVQQP